MGPVITRARTSQPSGCQWQVDLGQLFRAALPEHWKRVGVVRQEHAGSALAAGGRRSHRCQGRGSVTRSTPSRRRLRARRPITRFGLSRADLWPLLGRFGLASHLAPARAD